MLFRRKPALMLASVFGLLILSFIITGIRSPKVVFFPQSDPNFIYTYINMPIGTDQTVTDSVTREVEKRIYKIIGTNNKDVESVISNVAIGAGDQNERCYHGPVAQRQSNHCVRGVPVPGRRRYHRRILAEDPGSYKRHSGRRNYGKQEQNGPPVGKPISIEISGEDFGELIKLSKNIRTVPGAAADRRH